MTVLLLGGTTEAYALAERLHDAGIAVVSSLAGRTTLPRLPAGEVRIGGFGGIAGLTHYLQTRAIRAIVDATHPFAAQMPFHAVAACAAVGAPYVRLLRPAWTLDPGDDWHTVSDLRAAAAALPLLAARRVFLTTGRQELAPFAALDDIWFLIRSIEAPDPQPLSGATVILTRGPFTLSGEIALLQRYRIDVIVTKNAGGSATAAKLTAARRVGIPVVMIDRPAQPPGLSLHTVQAAAGWVTATIA